METFMRIMFIYILEGQHGLLFGKVHVRAFIAGECPREGSTDKKHCCPNYRLNGNECEECPPGSMGEKCGMSCPSGWYGKFCQMKCACKPPMVCDPIIGCTCKHNICQLDKASTVSLAKRIPESTSLTPTPDNEIETTIYRYHRNTKRNGGKYTPSERNAQFRRSICTSNHIMSNKHLEKNSRP